MWVKIVCPSAISSREIRNALKGCPIMSLSTRKEGREFILGFSSQAEAARALSLSSVGDRDVSAQPFQPVRTSGTISSRELGRWSVDDLLEELDRSLVLDVTRLASGGRLEGSGRFRLDFTTTPAPREVKLQCGLILQVQLYVPAPLRCRKCLNYRHHEDSCSRPRRCTNCGAAGHLSDACTNAACCAACGAPHRVTDPSCPVFLREKGINRLVAESACSRQEANAQLPAAEIQQRPCPPAPAPVIPGCSYASVTCSSVPVVPTNQPSSVPIPAPMLPDPMAAVFESFAQLTMLLGKIAEQNAKLIQQNDEVIRLLKTPKLKQTTITPVRTRSKKSPAAPKATTNTPTTTLRHEEQEESPPSPRPSQSKRMRQAANRDEGRPD